MPEGPTTDPPANITDEDKKSARKSLDYSVDPVHMLGDDVATGDIISSSDYTEDEYKALTNKIDRFLMPMMFFFYGIQQTDKTSTGVQAVSCLLFKFELSDSGSESS
ncbi:hypothetical protein N7470_002892 [Penicillium chermesinum]|nr:hypothetical protein N7470_002892 [Penicillium chermesinum]